MDFKGKNNLDGKEFVNCSSIYNSTKGQICQQMQKQKKIWIAMVEEEFQS